MATWKKVIVSGSAAELLNVTASSGVLVGTIQQITTSATTTKLSGSFSGSFFGDGSGLSGVAASFPITAKTDLATTDQFFINDGSSKFVTYGNLVTDLAGAGAGTSNLTTGDTGDSLALTAQIAVTGVTASFTGNLTGTASYATSASQAITASYVLQAVSASFATNAANATNATNATNTAITDTTTGTGPYYITFVDATTGNAAQRVDSTGLTYNATTNVITATASLATTASYVLQAVSASFATLARTADTASYVLQAVSASFATLAQTANTASFVVTAQTASYVLQAVSASFATLAQTANSASNITNAITNAADNRLLTANVGGTINGESNLSFDGTTLSVTGNATLTGNLTVAGTASFTNTDNLNIRDKFILINSGSATLSDSGWITQYNAAGSGSAFYLDAGTGNDHGPYGRFAVAFDTVGTTTSPTVSEYVVTAKINQASNPTNVVPPTWGTGSNGSGNMWITNAGDIFIYG
jgi:hypothetical protein